MGNFWFKFEWELWRNDKQLRRCSKETRGFWIDCIAVMEEQQTFFIEGTPDEICREVVADRGEFDRAIAELSRTGAATIEKCQEVVKIVSRRLLRKVNLTEYNRLKKQEERERRMSSGGQDPPSKDIDFKSFRALDSSPIGEEVNAAKPPDPVPEQKPDGKPKPAEKKTLLPADYRPSDEMIAWFEEECPDLRLEAEHEEFVTFWCDIATKNNKRTLRGWNATWKKRMRERQASVPAALRGPRRTRDTVGRPREAATDPPPIEVICERCCDLGVIDKYPDDPAGFHPDRLQPCPECAVGRNGYGDGLDDERRRIAAKVATAARELAESGEGRTTDGGAGRDGG